jgi:hypothetical protein
MLIGALLFGLNKGKMPNKNINQTGASTGLWAGYRPGLVIMALGR